MTLCIVIGSVASALIAALIAYCVLVAFFYQPSNESNFDA